MKENDVNRPKAWLLAFAWVLPLFGLLPAHAAGDNEIETLRGELTELRRTYEARLQALEQRLETAEAQRTPAVVPASTAQASPPEAAGAARAQSAGTFNPALSLILNGTFSDQSLAPSEYRVTGYQPAGQTAPLARSFSLGESELFVTANVDHYFMGALNLSLNDADRATVEEAYFRTLELGRGLNLKGGRFLSGIGYQNSVHAHAWDFVDPSLVQRALLGDNYGDDGLQLTWLAPTDRFLELGVEAGRGHQRVGYAADNPADANGVGSMAAFAHLGDDVGTGGSYRLGLSYLRQRANTVGLPLADLDTVTGTTNLFRGRSSLYGLDAVYKWSPQGNTQYQGLKLVAEVFSLHRDGILTYDVNPSTGGAGAQGLGPQVDPLRLTQTGWYIQGVWQFDPVWRTGLRYDRLEAPSLEAGANASRLSGADFRPQRLSLMLDWNPSEFSRIRLQLSQDRSQPGARDDQIFLQYNYSLGAHGAHGY